MSKHFTEDMGESYGFVGRDKPHPINLPGFDIEPDITWSDDVEVIVLRPLLFFYATQKITLGKLRELFTPKAIRLLEKDGLVKLNIDHGEPEDL